MTLLFAGILFHIRRGKSVTSGVATYTGTYGLWSAPGQQQVIQRQSFLSEFREADVTLLSLLPCGGASSLQLFWERPGRGISVSAVLSLTPIQD